MARVVGMSAQNASPDRANLWVIVPFVVAVIGTVVMLFTNSANALKVALIFALFLTNPAPICVLDEVDAPLDDANVGRYAKLVKEMSENVQFIYITHNKIAMEAAERLMGVTMQEPGVSRLVSVGIDEAAALVD